MRRAWLGAFGTVLVLAALPAAAASQQTRTCRQTRPSDFQRIVNVVGQELLYFKDPVHWVCTGGIVLDADSAVMNRAASTIELVGGVLYRDTARELTSDWANYVGREDQLFARGNVRLRDLANASVITGEQLDYRRETPERPMSRMIVQGGRPHAILHPGAENAGEPAVDTAAGMAGDTAAAPPDTVPLAGRAPVPDSPADTATALEVWGRVIEIDGQDQFIANGDVELLRGDMRGAGQSVRYQRDDEQLTLVGHAHVENDRYRLEGERIEAVLQEDTLREIRADNAARLVSDELTVRAQRLRIGFSAGEIDRLEAWTRQPASPSPQPKSPDSAATAVGLPAAAAPPRALALAKDFHLSADSIDALADSGAIREVRAVGSARGERNPDSTAARVPGVVASDWVQGDTIIGYFARQPVPADSLTPTRRPATEGETTDSMETVLERILVVGTGAPALSLYRLQPERPDCSPPINYMQAKRIDLFLTHGEVERVEAEGPIEGRYLESTARCGAPADSAATPPPDSAGTPLAGAQARRKGGA